MADFEQCNVNVYSESGEYLGNFRIASFDKKENIIEVPDLPEDINGACEVVILSSPAPFAFKAVARRFGGMKQISLYEGRMTEQRKAARYKADIPAVIEHLVFDDKNHALHTPLQMQIINISKTGLRLRGKTNDLIVGLRPRIRLNVGKGDQILTADIVNSKYTTDGIEEFGCALYRPKNAGGHAGTDDE